MGLIRRNKKNGIKDGGMPYDVVLCGLWMVHESEWTVQERRGGGQDQLTPNILRSFIFYR